MEQIENLLQEISKITNDFEKKKLEKSQCAENTGNLFNIFDILGIGTREVYMCKILAELLNPDGLHCQGRKYLDLFCKRFLPFEIKTEKKVSVVTEDLTKNLEDIGKENRRIDIVIDEKDGHYIPIEVKINAYEQKEQCQDYLNSTRKIYKSRNIDENEAIIVYLTKFGLMPISISNTDKEKVKCISWYQIIDWLNDCICQIDTIRKIPITEIIMQYKTTIEQFLKEDNDMNQDVIKKIKENAEYFKSAEIIAKNFDLAANQIWQKLKATIEAKFPNTQKYNDVNDLNNIEDGELYYSDSNKIVYSNKYAPDGENIANFNVIVYEKGKIQKAQIKYRDKKVDGSGYVKPETASRTIIPFESIINNIDNIADDCYDFLLNSNTACSS